MTSLMSENVLFTALQPNNTTVSTYAVPSETQLPHGGTLMDEAARARRVQQQVAERLATLPRRNNTSTSASSSTSAQYATASSAQYPTSDYSSSATLMKLQTYNPGFTSRSHMYATSRPVMAHRASQHSTSGYSSRSAMDFGTRSQMSQGAAGGLVYDHDDMGVIVGGGYQGRQSQQYQRNATIHTHGVHDTDAASLHSLRLHSLPQQQVATWVARNGSEGSLGSDQDHAYKMNNGYPTTCSLPFSVTANEFNSGTRQASMTMPSMRRSLSGTMGHSGGIGVNMDEEAYVRQSFKGPAQRTINRTRQNRTSMSVSSMQGGSSAGGFVIGGNSCQGTLNMVKQGRLSRAPSVRSMISVGKGRDVYDGMDMTGSMGNLSGLGALDLHTAVSYLESLDKDQQALGAAYIQHECYNNKESKKIVNELKGITPLIQLFNSESQKVQQFATGAARNLIYENMENKVALINAGGIPKLLQALKEQDDEIQKNITGILWNLSSKDTLKEKLAQEVLPQLTEEILIPLSGTGERELIDHSESEADIFSSTTGCLRNLSSVSKQTRQQMRMTNGLVESLVHYVKRSVNDSRVEEKGVENAVCVLRNLSFQLYDELPPSVLMRLEGPDRNEASRGEPIGCFTHQSRKAKSSQHQDLSTFTEVARVPKACEWLWHPQMLEVYRDVLVHCETNTTTREAAAGALQNITAGDKRWPSILSRVATEQGNVLPTVLDHLKSSSDLELRTLAGLLRNLSRHAMNKNSLAPKVVPHLLSVLPEDGRPKTPSPEVIINICGALNNLVSCSEVAARDIAFYDGLQKLAGIKTNHDNSPSKTKQARAAATVMSNMFQYKKLHKEYKKKGFSKSDFSEFI